MFPRYLAVRGGPRYKVRGAGLLANPLHPQLTYQ